MRFENKKSRVVKTIVSRVFFLTAPFVVFFVFVVFILEVHFYLKHGDFFFRKSIHFQLSELTEKNLLEKLPTMDESYKEKFFQVETNNDITEKISMPSYVEPGKYAVMFSCWVWTREPGKVRLVLLKDGESIKSAYHSGSGRWELLSVSAFADAKEYEIIITSKGASFKYHKLPILFSETRSLSKVSPQTRGEIFYPKHGKLRIVFIGGSTTFGTGTLHTEGADYPYVLQQMFDSVYPGQVNVLNYGLSAHSMRHFIPYRERIKMLGADIVCVVPPWNDSSIYLKDRYIYKDRLINYSKWIDRLEQGIGNRIALGYYLKNILTGLHNKVAEAMLADYEKQVDSKGQSSTFFDAFGDEITKNPPFNYTFYSQLGLVTDFLRNQGSFVYYGLLPFYASNKEKITDKDIALFNEIRSDAKALTPQIQMTIPLSKMDRIVVEKASKNNHVPFVDLVHYYAFDQVVPKQRFDYFADPVHLSRAGNIFVAKGFFEALIHDVSARLKDDKYAYFLGDAVNPARDMAITAIEGQPCSAENKVPLVLPWIPAGNFQIIDDLIRATGTGEIRTKPFAIGGSFLRFKLMGDTDINNPDVLGIKFFVDGKLVGSVMPVCNTRYCETYVDMHDYIGKDVVVEIVDKEHDPKLALYDASFE